MPRPVGSERVQIARDYGLKNVAAIAFACREAEVPFAVACALMEQESGGRNVYGHDAGGALSGYPRLVTEENFKVFEWLVFDQGQTSNGVGPAQITYKGYFTQMKTEGLLPWDAHDNMLFGLRILRANFNATNSWEKAGARYNGGPRPNADAQGYGRDLAEKIDQWRKRFRA